MCGIYGYIGKPTNKTKKALRALGLINEIRGSDSAGFAVIYPKKYYLYKKAVNSTTFWEAESPNKYIGIDKNSERLIFLGHTRQATTGAINDKNAHPFKIGNIILTHNGQINNFETLQAMEGQTFEVDSQIVAYLLNFTKPKIVFEDQVRGWFTIPYVDLNNPQRVTVAVGNAPFSFAVTNHGIYYSSLMEHLKQALNYAGIRASIGNGSEKRLYTFEYNDAGVSIRKENLNITTYDYDFVDYFGRKYFDY